MEEIYLAEKAFIGLIVSSVEVFRDECLGILLGYRESDRMTVEYAIPYQSAKRRKGSVDANLRRDAVCKGLLPSLSHLEHLGYFHSHTQFGNRLAIAKASLDDFQSMREGQIEIIVAVNEASRRKEWMMHRDGHLSGTIGEYSLGLRAYHFHPQKLGWKDIDIICPYAVGFDYAFLP